MANQTAPRNRGDDLRFRVEKFARFSLRARGEVPAALLTLGLDEQHFFIPFHFADDRAKDNFANNA